MACKTPCFDCPYLIGSEKLKIADTIMFEYIFTHHTEDGGYEPIMCEEQNDICFGQIQLIANGLKTGIDPFSELGEAVGEMSRNTEIVFSHCVDFMRYHEAL